MAGSDDAEPTVIEHCDVDVTLRRLDEAGESANRDAVDARTPRVTLRDCTGSLAIQNGVVTAESSRLRFGFGGAGTEYPAWNGGIGGTFTDCAFAEQAFGLHELSPDQRRDFAGRFRLTGCRGKPILKSP